MRLRAVNQNSALCHGSASRSTAACCGHTEAEETDGWTDTSCRENLHLRPPAAGELVETLPPPPSRCGSNPPFGECPPTDTVPVCQLASCLVKELLLNNRSQSQNLDTRPDPLDVCI
ncbi:unnamed protein product [Pleuronectes platessa]|uniref:Uncharacterized protein n=1 Tax=Pleuronectes platessa TaxID=8262 RepID=A0A9N7UYC0_PLEPL|nr:unnamed protein product [Pleuronectes platessa]